MRAMSAGIVHEVRVFKTSSIKWIIPRSIYREHAVGTSSLLLDVDVRIVSPLYIVSPAPDGSTIFSFKPSTFIVELKSAGIDLSVRRKVARTTPG